MTSHVCGHTMQFHADGYSIIEAKYFINPMVMDEIHREIGQVREISELDIKQIGFISINGFVEKEDGCLYYTGTDLYDTAVTALRN